MAAVTPRCGIASWSTALCFTALVVLAMCGHIRRDADAVAVDVRCAE
jgi:hypothetical protein